jgi:type IV pilus assembly protein PilA
MRKPFLNLRTAVSAASKGFTLIELMVVLVIIGLLATFGIPSYLSYVHRTKVSEGLALSTEAKFAIQQYFITYNALPNSNTEAALPAANTIVGEYVSSVSIGNNGIVTITYNHKSSVEGKTLLIIPTLQHQRLKWACQAGSVELNTLLPSSCSPYQTPQN